MKHLETSLEKSPPEHSCFFGDKGYEAAQNRAALSRMKVPGRIMHKGTKSHKITEWETRVNQAISKIKYHAERTLGSILRWSLGGTARYVGLAKTHAQHLMEGDGL